MGQDEKLWIVYDIKAKKQSKPLETLRAQKFIMSLKASEYELYLIWTPGWERWLPIQEAIQKAPDFFTPPPVPGAEAPVKKEPAPENKAVLVNEVTETRTAYTTLDKATGDPAGYWAKDFSIHDVVLNPKSVDIKGLIGDDRRKRPRHDFRFEIIIFTDKKSFKTLSTNISTTGILIQEDLPKDMLNQNLQVILINKMDDNPSTNKFFFDGKIVGDIINPKRISFENMTDEMVKKLEVMFANYEALIKKRKSAS